MNLGIDDREFNIPKYSSVCTYCTHVTGFRHCTAFGDREIPLEIWNGENDHTKPYPGDRGIRFTRARRPDDSDARYLGEDG